MKLKSLGYYTESLNDGLEYAIREDGAVFAREKYYGRYGWTKGKWFREPEFVEWDEELKDLPQSYAFGFGSRGRHYFCESTRLRLPQTEK